MLRRAFRAFPLVTLAAAGAVLVAGHPGFGAAESYPVPADGTFHLIGHGFGHGHGMSQYGAEGAAGQGVSAAQIVATYYPGTTAAQLPDSSIRVRLHAYADRYVVVAQANGLTATDRATGRTVALTAPANASAPEWRVVTDTGGLRLQYPSGSQWLSVPDQQTEFAGPISLSSTDPSLHLSRPDGSSAAAYRGSVLVTRDSATAVHVVNDVAMQSYLYSVVPSEMPPSWGAAALQAQAIAARSYAEYHLAHPQGSDFDICDTWACQEYTGTAAEQPATTAAVNSTDGAVRTYQGAPIFAEFSASDGGWTAAGSEPYLQAFADSWDTAQTDPEHDWSVDVSAASIERAFPAVGTLTALVVTGRDGQGDWGGRVSGVELDGVDASGQATAVPVSGGSWQAAIGLRSTYWTVSDPTAAAPSPSPSASPSPTPTPAPQHTAWRELAANSTGAATTSVQFGPGQPVAGDWNGDGRDTPGVVAAVNGQWQWTLSNAADGSGPLVVFSYGPTWCAPVVGDWNGDGRTTPGIVCPQSGQLRWRLSNVNATSAPAYEFLYGPATATPVVGDWDANGTQTPGVVRPVAGQLYWQLSDRLASGSPAAAFSYGAGTDRPVAGDWAGAGRTGVGAVRAGTSSLLWQLRSVPGPGSPTARFTFGAPGEQTLAGAWSGRGAQTAATVEPAP